MDREKVIKALEYFNKNRICLSHLIPWDEIVEAIALLKENDYRSWLMDMFHKYGRDDLIALLVLYGEENLLAAMLKEQEAAEPKTGHWTYLQYCANEGVYCSVCHTKMFDSYPMKKKLSQFCGHCGAKMSDEVEGR